MELKCFFYIHNNNKKKKTKNKKLYWNLKSLFVKQYKPDYINIKDKFQKFTFFFYLFLKIL